MTDPDLLDAQHQAEALLADAAEAVSLREQLASAHAQLGEWREAVVAANRLSQEFEARALRAEAALEEARSALSLPAEPLPDGFPYTVPGEEYARGYRDGHLASVEWLDNGPEFEFAAHALRQAILPGQPSPAEPASPEVPGVRRCQDCGSLRFDRGGAAALDEARAVGFRQGIEEAAMVVETDPNVESPDDELWMQAIAYKIRSLAPPSGSGSKAALSTPADAPCATCGDGLFTGSTTLGTLRPCPDCMPVDAPDPDEQEVGREVACPDCGEPLRGGFCDLCKAFPMAPLPRPDEDGWWQNGECQECGRVFAAVNAIGRDRCPGCGWTDQQQRDFEDRMNGGTGRAPKEGT